MNSAIVFSRPTGSSPEPQKSSRISAESLTVSLISTEWMLLAGIAVIAVRQLTANLTDQEDTRSATICTEPRIRARPCPRTHQLETEAIVKAER